MVAGGEESDELEGLERGKEESSVAIPKITRGSGQSGPAIDRLSPPARLSQDESVADQGLTTGPTRAVRDGRPSAARFVTGGRDSSHFWIFRPGTKGGEGLGPGDVGRAIGTARARGDLGRAPMRTHSPTPLASGAPRPAAGASSGSDCAKPCDMARLSIARCPSSRPIHPTAASSVLRTTRQSPPRARRRGSRRGRPASSSRRRRRASASAPAR